MKKLVLIFLMVIPLALVSVSQNCATFEELLVPANGYWNGADGSGKFVSGNMVFYNSYNAAGGYWSGFAYSSKTDRSTPGFGNQYSAITGKGVGNSTVYAVAYDFGNLRITLNQPDSLSGLFVTNSTYAYLTLRDGDTFSEKFGGISGNDPDWFRINCFGISAKGDTTGKVVFYLADFRSANQSGDYIVNTWKWMDLSSLGTVSELKFSLESTDIGEWGMNTPAFFCLDDVNGQMLTSSLVADIGEGVNIYPQPFNEALTVESNHMIEKVVIIDIWGRTVAEATPSRTNRFILQGLAGMPSGMYIVMVSGDGFETSRRIVKK